MYENSNQASSYEIDLVDLIKKLFKQTGLIIGFALLFASLGGVFQFSRLAFYAPKLISYPVAIEFSSAENSSYPNGTGFSFLDIIDSENIKSALSETKLDFKVRDIISNISINNSNQLLIDAEKVLLQKLGEKKLPEDQVAVTRKMLSELRKDAKIYATLSLDLSKLKLSENDAEKFLKNIASNWADNAIRKGLVAPNISYPGQPFVYDKKAVIIDNYDKLVVYSRNLQSAFSRLQSLSASDTVIIDEQNLNDISRKVKGILVNDIEVMRAYAYSISPALVKDNPLLEVQIFSQRRVKKLNKEELEKKINAYDEVLAQLGYKPERTNMDAQLSMKGESKDPSFDKGILNELLNLGSKLSSSELRTEIVNRRIKTAEQLFVVEKEIAMIEGNVSTQSSVNQQEIIASMPSIFDKSVSEINELQKTFVEILTEYKKINLNKGSALYSPVANAYVSNPLEINLKKTLIILIAAGVVGVCLGVIVALLRSAFIEDSKNNIQK